MVLLKTKVDKHVQDNEKRRKSIKEKEKAKLNQTQIIKQALSNSSLSNTSSKKIVFNDDSDNDDGFGDRSHKSNGKEKTALFESSGSEDESFEIKEKTQFGDKKGFELLNLQSTYGNDDRFKIDERFLDDEKDDGADEREKEMNGKSGAAEEKVKQLKILESVLGQPIVTPEVEKKAKSRTFEMVRYDATNKDHQKYEIKTEPKTPELSKKKRDRKKTPKDERELSPKPQVSKEKFYQVSTEIKTAFKEKKEDGQFSLLQTYGVDDGRDEEIKEDEEEEEEEEEEEKMDVDGHELLPQQEDIDTPSVAVKKQEAVVEKTRPSEKVTVAQGIWKESFFFFKDDPRLKEGLDFISKKNSEEAAEAAENYDKTRRKLKEILRLHMKKQLHKRDPFKNKVGGMNKKQLASSRYKTSKGSFNRNKLPKGNRTGSF